MTRWVQLSAILPLLIAAALLATVVVAVVRKPRSLCRGPRSWMDWMPWRWFGRSCGYDLLGLPMEGGKVRCPECGTAQVPRSRRNLRVLPRLVAVVTLGCLAAACWKVSWIRYGCWAPYTPTWLLVQLDFLPMSGRIEDEMLARLEKGKVGAWQQRRMRSLAVQHLGDDRRSRNARWACDVLTHMGREALPALEGALDSPDWQRRQYAGELLRCWATPRWWDTGPPEPYDPPDRLLEVCLEGLGNDRFEYGNATGSFEFLLGHRERVLPLLPERIRSEDEQQSFLTAALAGFLEADDLAPLAAPVLVAHLHRNNRMGDARTAAPALVCLGDAARVYLLPAIDGEDAQARELGWAIVKTIDHQPLSVAERDRIKMVTTRYRDLREACVRPQRVSDSHD
jgi:hypothetical protein